MTKFKSEGSEGFPIEKLRQETIGGDLDKFMIRLHVNIFYDSFFIVISVGPLNGILVFLKRKLKDEHEVQNAIRNASLHGGLFNSVLLPVFSMCKRGAKSEQCLNFTRYDISLIDVISSKPSNVCIFLKSFKYSAIALNCYFLVNIFIII